MSCSASWALFGDTFWKTFLLRVFLCKCHITGALLTCQNTALRLATEHLDRHWTVCSHSFIHRIPNRQIWNIIKKDNIFSIAGQHPNELVINSSLITFCLWTWLCGQCGSCSVSFAFTVEHKVCKPWSRTLWLIYGGFHLISNGMLWLFLFCG